MLKKISVSELIPGMYIHDLNCEWMEHPFLTNSFPVDGKARIAKIRSLGIQEVYIDTDRGIDLPHAPTAEEVQADLHQRMQQIASSQTERPNRVDVATEAPRARNLHNEANRIIKNLMTDVRLGAQIEIERMEPLVENMIDSIFRNPCALLPLAGLKKHDTYTFEHSVSVCALMVAFARELELPYPVTKDIALGALLHDVGKAIVPDYILNKPARLTAKEFSKMQEHVVFSIDILQKTPGIAPIAMNVAAQHHERYDGSGYPRRLKGEEISLYGQMASIVDVYDAISSNRVYHRGLQPSAALTKLLEWSEHHFEPRLVHNFIRAIGIYPAGSLVRLSSGRLAVVREQNEGDLLYPQVEVIYNTDLLCYLTPEIIDLRSGNDSVVSHEDFNKWHINPKLWLPS
ncbi:MAG: HD-GYP domain-containing protein [Zoogloeaceae bacterium]|jgi:putative nucleotidyltransferase with HDIG domain|nr:HD-GYP domain-containing protein [Zoogloeaceae bacterium]